MRKIAMTMASIVLLASISPAQISQVTVKVDGLACAFCAYGLQKARGPEGPPCLAFAF